MKVRLHSGISYIHDGCTAFVPSTTTCGGLQVLNGAAYPTHRQQIRRSDVLRARRSSSATKNSFKTYYVNAALDTQTTWYGVPHRRPDRRNRQPEPRLRPFARVYLSYEVRQTSDVYNKASGRAARSIRYSTTWTRTSRASGAFAGSAAQRTLAFGLNTRRTRTSRSAMLARKHSDSPVPVPGLFRSDAQRARRLHQQRAFLGQPPYDVTGDLRMRVLRHYYLDIRERTISTMVRSSGAGFVIQVSQ